MEEYCKGGAEFLDEGCAGGGVGVEDGDVGADGEEGADCGEAEAGGPGGGLIGLMVREWREDGPTGDDEGSVGDFHVRVDCLEQMLSLL